MSNRTRVALGDALEVLIDHRGKTPTKLGGVWSDSGIRVVSAINIKDRRIDQDNLRYVPEEIFDKWMPVRLRRGDVLLTSEAPLGEVARVQDDEPICLGQRLFGLRGKPDLLDGGFLYYLLGWGEPRDEILGRATGTTVSGIRQSELVQVQLELPTLSEQRAIAGVLGALDDKIESNRRLVDLLRQNAKVTAEDACSNGKSRRLGDIAVFQRGFGYKSSGFAESGRPMISMGCSQRRGWLRRDKVRAYGDAVKEKYFVRAEQLLVVNVDLTWKLDVLGWPLLVPPDLDGAIISNDVFGVQFAEGDEWLSWVVWAELQTWSARSVIEGGAKGTTVASVGIDTLGQVETRIPDRDVGISVAEAMSAFIRRAWTAEQESVELTALRDALLPELLSGRIRVRDAEKVVEVAL